VAWRLVGSSAQSFLVLRKAIRKPFSGLGTLKTHIIKISERTCGLAEQTNARDADVSRDEGKLVLSIFLVIVGTLQPGCHRTSPTTDDGSRPSIAPQSEEHSGSAKSTARADVPAVAAIACRAPAAARIVAIGDLHGDLKAAKRAFMLAGATNSKDAWIGGQLVVVQTGDVLDRGDDERELLSFLDQQESASKAVGGHVYRLTGNHEAMNVQGDYRYVTAQGLKAYAGEPTSGRPEVTKFAPEQQGRAEAFLPGGRQARKLSSYPAVWLVGDTVFAHGGVLPSHVRMGLDEINQALSAFMSGQTPLPQMLQGENTPFWIRDYGESASDDVCAKLNSVLSSLKAKRLVVGHTPQKSGISFGCNQQLARIDVGLSAYYGNNPTEVLEIAGGTMKVLKQPEPGANR
jgi:hypothetical protein